MTSLIGRLKIMMGKIFFSTKERTTYQKMMHCDTILSGFTMTMQQQDTPENYKHSMQYESIIGGLECERSSRTMSKDAEHVSNSRLTEILRNRHINLLKGQSQLDLLLIVHWT